MKRRRNIQSPLSRPAIPVVVAVAAFALLVGTASVYGVQTRGSMLAAAAGGGQCEPKFKQCMQQDVPKKKKTAAQCEQEFQKCVLVDNKCKDKSGISGGQTCNKAPDCQTHCTESATGKGAILDCCKGGAKHVNSCPDEVDGKCNPQKKELGKEGEQKGGEPPKMPELPKPPESKDGGGGQPQQQPCGADSKTPGVAPAEGGEKRADCPPETKSGISSLFDMFSSSGEGGASSQRDTVSSALSKISSFFGGSQSSSESATSDENTTSSGTSNTGSTVDGSAVSNLGAQESTQGRTESGTGGNTQQNSLATGFTNSGADQSSPQSTTIFSSIVTRLKAALSWLNGL